MFGNAPKAMWERWCLPDEFNRIPLATRAMLLQLDDGRNVLFEVGAGACFDPKIRERYGIQESEHVLLKNLEALGLREEDIDIVILSHLHFDHAGGLLPAYEEGPPRLLFPNAKIYVGGQHWERAQRPHVRERVSFIPTLHELLKASDRLRLIEGETHPDLDFGVRFQAVHGHTVGLLVSKLDLPDGPIAFVSDLMPGRPWVHLPITMGYDRFSELVVDEKREFLEDWMARKGRLFFTHDPEVPCATIERNEKGRYQAAPAAIEAVS